MSPTSYRTAPPRVTGAREENQYTTRPGRGIDVAAPRVYQLLKNWTLLAGGKPLFSQSRFLVVRTYFLNHAIHHRAQLGMFLRLIGVAVPAVYNASADEAGRLFIDQAAAALGSR